MVSFSAPLWLVGLLFTPLIYLLNRRRKQNGLIAAHLIKQAPKREQKTVLCLMLAWVISMLALAGPHWRENDRPSFELDRARVFVLDMSHAMYVTDISPNRFRQAFYKVTDLIQASEQGYTGLVAYAAQGYTISPLTHDYNTVLNHMEFLSPELMPSQGKNANAGVVEAIKLLDQASLGYGDIVLVTSGISETESVAIKQSLKGTQYTLSTYAISTVTGGKVISESGEPYLDGEMQPIVSRLVPERLSELSSLLGGISVTYQHSQQDVERLTAFLNQHKDSQGNGKQMLTEQMVNDGYWLLWPLSFLLLFAFRKGVVWSLGILLLMPMSDAHAMYRNDDRQGYDLFLEQRYQEAAEVFTDPAWQGVAHYKAGDYQAAVDALSLVNDGSSDYNLGNALARLGQLEQAIEMYQQVLEHTPDHSGAAVNLALVEQALQAKITEESEGESAGEGDANQDEESGDSEGEQEREEDSDNEHGGDQDQLESDPDSENVAEQKGMSEQAGSTDSSGQESNQPQFADEGGSDSSPPMQQFGESGEYESDNFTAGASDIDFGVPTESDLEAMRHELSQLGEVNPVLNQLSQIQDDRSLLLRNLLLLQHEQKQSAQDIETEW